MRLPGPKSPHFDLSVSILLAAEQSGRQTEGKLDDNLRAREPPAQVTIPIIAEPGGEVF